MFAVYTVLNINKMKTCGGGGGGGEGEKDERGCILKQQNLSRAMRDWDLMHEEGTTLSTMHVQPPSQALLLLLLLMAKQSLYLKRKCHSSEE